MPITIEIVDENVTWKDFEAIKNYFTYIDKTFSPFNHGSEISKINQGLLEAHNYSDDVIDILKLGEETRLLTKGYFNVYRNGKLDPLGLVKGWAIVNASYYLRNHGYFNFYIDAGGDIEVSGRNAKGKKWDIGIKNPFDSQEIVKVVLLEKGGIATSGTYNRGQHIYDPHKKDRLASGIVSLSVIGPNVFEADRFATAAFAMKEKGIEFIESLDGFEGYMINKAGIATMTSGFSQLTK